MTERGSAHDRGECIVEICPHPDHFVEDGEVDLDQLIHQQLVPEPAEDRDFEGIDLT